MYKINLANELEIEKHSDLLIIKKIFDNNKIGFDIQEYEEKQILTKVEKGTLIKGKDFK